MFRVSYNYNSKTKKILKILYAILVSLKLRQDLIITNTWDSENRRNVTGMEKLTLVSNQEEQFVSHLHKYIILEQFPSRFRITPMKRSETRTETSNVLIFNYQF